MSPISLLESSRNPRKHLLHTTALYKRPRRLNSTFTSAYFLKRVLVQAKQNLTVSLFLFSSGFNEPGKVEVREGRTHSLRMTFIVKDHDNIAAAVSNRRKKSPPLEVPMAIDLHLGNLFVFLLAGLISWFRSKKKKKKRR